MPRQRSPTSADSKYWHSGDEAAIIGESGHPVKPRSQSKCKSCVAWQAPSRCRQKSGPAGPEPAVSVGATAKGCLRRSGAERRAKLAATPNQARARGPLSGYASMRPSIADKRERHGAEPTGGRRTRGRFRKRVAADRTRRPRPGFGRAARLAILAMRGTMVYLS